MRAPRRFRKIEDPLLEYREQQRFLSSRSVIEKDALLIRALEVAERSG